MTAQAQQLRSLIDAGEHFVAADCYSVLTARIVERIGFKAAYLGGHACGAFHYGVPDNGVLSPVEQIEQASRIAASIDIPLVVDADSLGETVADAFHFTRRYVRAGIAGIHVEDEVNPKHSSFVNGLIPVEAMQARLEAVVRGRGDSPFVIIARCDELYTNAIGGGGGGSVPEAIARGRAYLDVGADLLMFPLAGADATAELASAFPGKVCTMSTILPDTVCSLHTGWGFTGAAQTHFERARTLFETGSLKASPTFEDKAMLTEEDLFNDLIADWAARHGGETR